MADPERAASRQHEGTRGKRSVELPDALAAEVTLNAEAPRLLPTPQAADGTGGRQEKSAMRNHGKRPSGQKGTLTLGTAVELRGELSSRPFADGSKSSGDQLPGQLTIEDDSLPRSSSG